jgi:hypothetical protein
MLNTLVTNIDGEVASSSDVEQYKNALLEELAPRNSSGVPTANAGSLGTSLYPWSRAHVTVGGHVCGEIKILHDFNGTITPGQGWMKCNGDQVTEAAYNAIHGAGSWDLYIISSPLANLHLPNMTGKYPVGVAATTQTGGSAITYVGNTSHQINIAHTHTGPSHNHLWLNYTGTNTSAQSYNSGGSAINLDASTNTADADVYAPLLHETTHLASFQQIGVDCYTNDSGTGSTNSQLSSTQSIQPHSAEFEFWIRII